QSVDRFDANEDAFGAAAGRIEDAAGEQPLRFAGGSRGSRRSGTVAEPGRDRALRPRRHRAGIIILLVLVGGFWRKPLASRQGEHEGQESAANQPHDATLRNRTIGTSRTATARRISPCAAFFRRVARASSPS